LDLTRQDQVEKFFAEEKPELMERGAKAVDYTGKIEWDTSKSNGTLRKLLDVSKSQNWAGLIKQNWKTG
jgi:GDP-L-fucose synthase